MESWHESQPGLVGLPGGRWTPVLQDLHGNDSITQFSSAKHGMTKSPIAVLCIIESLDIAYYAASI